MSCYLLKEGHLRSAYEFYGDDRWYLGLLFFFFVFHFMILMKEKASGSLRLSTSGLERDLPPGPPWILFFSI